MSLKGKSTLDEEHLRQKLKKLMEESEKLKAKKTRTVNNSLKKAALAKNISSSKLVISDSNLEAHTQNAKNRMVPKKLNKRNNSTAVSSSKSVKSKTQVSQKQESEMKPIPSNTSTSKIGTKTVTKTVTATDEKTKTNIKAKIQLVEKPTVPIAKPLPKWKAARAQKIIDAEDTSPPKPKLQRQINVQNPIEAHVKEHTKGKSKLMKSALKRPAGHAANDSPTVKKVKKVQINEKPLNLGVPVKKTQEHVDNTRIPSNARPPLKESKAVHIKVLESKRHGKGVVPTEKKAVKEDKEKKSKKTDFDMKGFFGKRDIAAFAINDTKIEESESDLDYAEVIDKFLGGTSTDDDDSIIFGGGTDDSFDAGSLSDSSDACTENKANLNDTSFETNLLNSTDDSDYELPASEVEDLIVHKGTAHFHELEPDQNKLFEDIGDEQSKLVEIKEFKAENKTVTQPKEYSKEELLKLSLSVKPINKEVPKQHTCNKNIPIEDSKFISQTEKISEPCPKLVPIPENAQKEGEMETDTESNASSQQSIDINTKYMYTLDDYYLGDTNERPKKPKLAVTVVDATKCKASLGIAKQTDNAKDIEKDLIDLSSKPNCSLNVDQHCTIQFVGLFEQPQVSKACCEEPISPEESVKTDDLVEKVTDTVPEKVSIETTSETNTTEKVPEYVDCQDMGNSNFKTAFYNSFDSYNVLVLVKQPFYVYGTVKLELVAGAIELYGHTPKPGVSLEIYSPRGSSMVQISNCAAPDVRDLTSASPLKEYLAKWEDNFLPTDLQKLKGQYDPTTDAIVVLQRNVGAKKLLHNFRMFMNENVFPNMQNIHKERAFGVTEHLLQCIINAESDKALHIPEQWQQITMAENSKMMIVGGKAVGKSTLLRYLINKNLSNYNSILLIDLDIGQAETFVPQTVSYTVLKRPLIGPGFLLNEQPNKSYLVGHSSITMCPHVYMKCVTQLLNDCKADEELSRMPWLINTMGYNKGFAMELLSRIVLQLQPTDVVQVQSSKEMNNFDAILEPYVLMNAQKILLNDDANVEVHDLELPHYRLQVLQTAVQHENRYQQDWSMSAKDMRYAMLLSRLSLAIRGNTEWLSECKPVCASINDLKLVNTVTDNQSRDEILEAMEANLVYLCHYVDDDTPLECLAVGVVRAIDYNLEKLYLLPATQLPVMKRVNCLALGEMLLPNAMFINQGPKVKENVPFVYRIYSDNATKAIKQIFHRPAEFLSGAHKKLIDN